jgi:hypothetical protein
MATTLTGGVSGLAAGGTRSRHTAACNRTLPSSQLASASGGVAANRRPWEQRGRGRTRTPSRIVGGRPRPRYGTGSWCGERWPSWPGAPHSALPPLAGAAPGRRTPRRAPEHRRARSAARRRAPARGHGRWGSGRPPVPDQGQRQRHALIAHCARTWHVPRAPRGSPGAPCRLRRGTASSGRRVAGATRTRSHPPAPAESRR